MCAIAGTGRAASQASFSRSEEAHSRLAAESRRNLQRSQRVDPSQRGEGRQELLRRAGPLDEDPTYAEALVLLARSARAGKVQAQVGLERALRGAVDDSGGDWLERILDGRS